MALLEKAETDVPAITRADYAELAAFRKALRKFLRFVEEGARDSGLTPQQHQVLLAIRGFTDRDWASVGEIADSLQLEHNTTVGLIDRCHLAGLVERTRDTEDRRVVKVSLTPAGEKVLEHLTRRNLNEIRALGKLTRELKNLVRE
jgi:DNA-binding MarR family transcriptional regulator